MHSGEIVSSKINVKWIQENTIRYLHTNDGTYIKGKIYYSYMIIFYVISL
jgi:hypothetical protein